MSGEGKGGRDTPTKHRRKRHRLRGPGINYDANMMPQIEGVPSDVIPNTESPWEIFCDLDGVLADFDGAVLSMTGKTPSDMSAREMWSRIAGRRNFFASLRWTVDGQELWRNISHLKPTILTGCPHGTWAPPQKRVWCARELGAHVDVITCFSRDKHLQAKGRHSILIDDRPQVAQALWEGAGGTFVTHTDTETTLAALRELGVLEL